MLPPLPRRSVWAYGFRSVTQPCQPSPKGLSGRPAHRPFRGLLSVFEACLAFTLVAACTLALSPIRDTHSEGFSQFVTSLAAPVASGWSGRRVGLAPTGKRRLVTAHTHNSHRDGTPLPCVTLNRPSSSTLHMRPQWPWPPFATLSVAFKTGCKTRKWKQETHCVWPRVLSSSTKTMLMSFGWLDTLFFACRWIYRAQENWSVIPCNSIRIRPWLQQ